MASIIWQIKSQGREGKNGPGSAAVRERKLQQESNRKETKI